jgi:hypothetical protein
MKMLGMKVKHVFLSLFIIILDCIIFLFLGVSLMSIDDDSNFSEEWVFSKMNSIQKTSFISFSVWTVINILVLIHLIYRVIKWFYITYYKENEYGK